MHFEHLFKQTALWTTFLAGVCLAGWCSASAADASKKPPQPYPLDTCVVSGEKLGGDMGEPYVFTQDGREIKLCCKNCLKDFKKDSKQFISKLQSAEKMAAAKHPYPLSTCVVSGDKFGGDMGEPFTFTAAGRQVKLCCPSCLKDFNKDRAKFIKKIEDAEKQAKN